MGVTIYIYIIVDTCVYIYIYMRALLQGSNQVEEELAEEFGHSG